MSEQNIDNKNEDNENGIKRPMTSEEITAVKRKREVVIKRARQALSTATKEEKEEIFKKVHLERTVEQPKTFKGKWDNFWYHYKLLVIGIVVIVGLATFLIYDIATKTKYDITIMLASSHELSTPIDNIEEFQTQISEYAKDYNSDNEINISLSDIRVNENADAMTLQANIAKFMVSLSSVNDIIYIFDENLYNQCVDQGATFVDLSQYFYNENIVSDKYYLKNDSRFSGILGYEDMFLVVRDVNALGKIDDKMTTRYENAMDFVGNIVE